MEIFLFLPSMGSGKKDKNIEQDKTPHLTFPKLLRAASFLNTAAMCYLFIGGMVMRNEAGESRKKIGIMRISRNFCAHRS
jgi:hypothetical protein